jgi:hypothetical protein
MMTERKNGNVQMTGEYCPSDSNKQNHQQCLHPVNRHNDNDHTQISRMVGCDWTNITKCINLRYITQWFNHAVISSLSFMMGIQYQPPQHGIIHWISDHIHRWVQFVVPKFPKLQDCRPELHHLPNAIRELWENVANVTNPALSTSDFMLRNFDTNHDGTISPNELLNMTELLQQIMIRMSLSSPLQQPQPHEMSWFVWFRREWPLLDWKLGVFLWRSFGGILLLLAILSIVPGRLHAISGKVLRWPVLGITYFLITVELVYVDIDNQTERRVL